MSELRCRMDVAFSSISERTPTVKRNFGKLKQSRHSQFESKADFAPTHSNLLIYKDFLVDLEFIFINISNLRKSCGRNSK